MPRELIANPPRHVKHLAVGESAYIPAAMIDVDLEGRAFLRDELEVSTEPEGSRRDKITRTPDGIVVTLRAADLPTFRRAALLSYFTEYLPVVEIRIEPQETPEAL
jgi:hypothetical protein